MTIAEALELQDHVLSKHGFGDFYRYNNESVKYSNVTFEVCHDSRDLLPLVNIIFSITSENKFRTFLFRAGTSEDVNRQFNDTQGNPMEVTIMKESVHDAILSFFPDVEYTGDSPLSLDGVRWLQHIKQKHSPTTYETALIQYNDFRQKFPPVVVGTEIPEFFVPSIQRDEHGQIPTSPFLMFVTGNELVVLRKGECVFRGSTTSEFQLGIIANALGIRFAWN